MVIPTKKWALYSESIDSLLFNSICRFVNLSGGRASGPVVGAAFKAVEVRLRAWWVRLLPLPPDSTLFASIFVLLYLFGYRNRAAGSKFMKIFLILLVLIIVIRYTGLANAFSFQSQSQSQSHQV